MTYGSEILVMNKNRLRKLEILQNKTLREALNASWYTRNEELRRVTNTPRLEDHIKKIAKKAIEKMTNHHNNGIRKAVDYDQDENRRVKRLKTILKDH